MARNRNAKPNRPASQQIKDERQLIFKTPGALKTKYSVFIKTDSEHHGFHLAGVRSPAEALWLSLGEYFSNLVRVSNRHHSDLSGGLLSNQERT